MMDHPTAVIDPENRQSVRRFGDLFFGRFWGEKVNDHALDLMQEALREFANPSPRFPEPTGHLAVVIDADGEAWVNWRNPVEKIEHERPWVLASDSMVCREWADVSAVELSWKGIS